MSPQDSPDATTQATAQATRTSLHKRLGSRPGAASDYARRLGAARVAYYALHPAYVTLSAALLELVALLIVVPHAAEVEHMQPLAYITAFGCSLFFLWLFHHMVIARRFFLVGLILAVLLPFQAFLSLMIWERHLPQRYWGGQGFLASPIHESLAVAAVLVAASGLLLPAFFVLNSALKTTRRVRDIAAEHLDKDH